MTPDSSYVSPFLPREVRFLRSLSFSQTFPLPSLFVRFRSIGRKKRKNLRNPGLPSRSLNRYPNVPFGFPSDRVPITWFGKGHESQSIESQPRNQKQGPENDPDHDSQRMDPSGRGGSPGSSACLGRASEREPPRDNSEPSCVNERFIASGSSPKVHGADERNGAKPQRTFREPNERDATARGTRGCACGIETIGQIGQDRFRTRGTGCKRPIVEEIVVLTDPGNLTQIEVWNLHPERDSWIWFIPVSECVPRETDQR